MRIAVVHPSIERPKEAHTTYLEWLKYADEDFDYYLCTEPDYQYAYEKYFGVADVKVFNTYSAIESINKGAEMAHQKGFDILVVISDDFHCFEGWDKAIINAFKDKNNKILKTFDGIQKWLVTLPIMDKAYYETYGYVYNPKYVHMFADTEMTHVADITDCLIVRNDILFKHTQFNDSLNERNNKTWAHGEKIYLKRLKENFGVNPVKECTDKKHLDWISKHVQ